MPRVTARKCSLHSSHKWEEITGSDGLTASHCLQSNTRIGFLSIRSWHSVQRRSAASFNAPTRMDRYSVGASHRVYPHRKAAESQLIERAHDHVHHLHIHQRIHAPQRFHSHLVKLPEPPRLRPLVPEHRARVAEPRDPSRTVQAVLQIGAHDGRGVLRTQGYAAPAPVGEGVHLFRYDIRVLPDGALKQLRGLEERRTDALVSEPLERAFEHLLDVPPHVNGGRQDVLRSA
jgi:hypothetical protein